MSGLTETENTGHLVDAMASRFAAEDAARMKELNRLTRTGPQPAEEVPVAARKPKACCGSRGPRCLSTCKGATRADTTPTPKRLAQIVEAANRQAKAEKGPDFTAHTVVQLLAIIVAAQAELERREQELKEQLDAIRLARAG